MFNDTYLNVTSIVCTHILWNQLLTNKQYLQWCVWQPLWWYCIYCNFLAMVGPFRSNRAHGIHLGLNMSCWLYPAAVVVFQSKDPSDPFSAAHGLMDIRRWIASWSCAAFRKQKGQVSQSCGANFRAPKGAHQHNGCAHDTIAKEVPYFWSR